MDCTASTGVQRPEASISDLRAGASLILAALAADGPSLIHGAHHVHRVVNAGTRDKDLAWLREHAGGYEVSVEPRFDLAMVAVQGPTAAVP